MPYQPNAKPRAPRADLPAVMAGLGEFVTSAQLASLLGCTERTLYERRRDGSGPPFVRLTTNRVLYRKDDVSRWVDRRTFVHTAAEAAGMSAA